ncbi:MAG: HAD family hydrolase [Chthoniobacterales bacterium]
MKDLKLLVTDFDGTLVGFNTNESCEESLAIELGKISQDGVLWVINTGRPFSILLEGLEYFNSTVKPHFIITDERHLYYPGDDGSWKPLGDWNEQCDLLHDKLFQACGSFFEQIHDLIAQYNGAVRIHRDAQGRPEGLLATNGKILDEIASMLLEHDCRPSDFLFQRSDTHLRFCHQFYNKGSTLAELSRFLFIEADHILAIGDHHNDLAMLNGQVATMVACPSNAHDVVKKMVRQQGGHVSRYPTGKGTAEAIGRYHRGKTYIISEK